MQLYNQIIQLQPKLKSTPELTELKSTLIKHNAELPNVADCQYFLPFCCVSVPSFFHSLMVYGEITQHLDIFPVTTFFSLKYLSLAFLLLPLNWPTWLIVNSLPISLYFFTIALQRYTNKCTCAFYIILLKIILPSNVFSSARVFSLNKYPPSPSNIFSVFYLY